MRNVIPGDNRFGMELTIIVSILLELADMSMRVDLTIIIDIIDYIIRVNDFFSKKSEYIIVSINYK